MRPSRPGCVILLCIVCLCGRAHAQVTGAGFLPEASPEVDVAPHEAPFLFASHGWIADDRVAGARVDVWGRGIGLAAGADYIWRDGDDGHSINAAGLLRLAKQGTSITKPGIQAQLGVNLRNENDRTRWRAPATLGVFLFAPAPLPMIGRAAARVWLNGSVVWRESASTGGGIGSGFWLTFNQQRTWQQGWGIQFAWSATRFDGDTNHLWEVGINRVLTFGP